MSVLFSSLVYAAILNTSAKHSDVFKDCNSLSTCKDV